MRHSSGGPNPDLEGTIGEPRCLRGPGRFFTAWGRVVAMLIVQAVLAVACGGRAGAQGAWWNWWSAAGPTATLSTEHLADYLYTGQQPHPAVARIIAPESAGTSMGSGVLVDVNQAQGLVITNWHVVRDSRSPVLVQFADGFQSAGTVVRWDEAWDLAAIVIWKPPATPLEVADAPPQPGEPLTIAGFGRGVYREETGECTEYLSPGTGYPKEFVELKATARQGDSGGAILNSRRQLAGVLFGQNEGRTIGSCSVRVRTFLAAVGSSGFKPPVPGPDPVAAGLAVGQPSDRDSTAGAVHDRIAALPVAAVEQRSSYVPTPMLAQALPAPPALPPGATWPAVAEQPPLEASPLAGLGLPAWLPDPYVHRAALLSAAGGLALVVFGLKTIFGGRRE